MAKQRLVITKETLMRLLRVFRDDVNFKQFYADYSTMVHEVQFLEQLLLRNSNDDSRQAMLVASVLFQIALFVRTNGDVMREITNALDYREVSLDTPIPPGSTVFETYMGIDSDDGDNPPIQI